MNRLPPFPFLLLILFSFKMSAQTDSLMAVRGVSEVDISQIAVTDRAMIELLMPVMPGVGSDSRNLLSQQSVKPYMMPPRKLGKHGSTTSYALAALLEFYVNFDQNFKDNLSPDYISLSTENDNLEAAFKFLAAHGTVSAAIMPYDATAISTAVFATQKYKIAQYLHLFRPGTNGRQKIFEIRKALMRGNPVLIDMQLADSFSIPKENSNYEGTDASATRTARLLIVGYDQGKSAFEIYGFWGKEWGNNGYMWMDYKKVQQYAQNAYVLVPAP